MSFSKFDIEQIKNKIILSSEIEKKTNLTKKGQEHWCCCLFHEEKTPSMKINDELGSFYCFGCGAKGDIFTIYTDIYNFNFQDAVYELASKTGINIEKKTFKLEKNYNIIREILQTTLEWYKENLKLPEAAFCREYIKKRNLSEETIKKFHIGFSFNAKKTLFEFLKNKNFDEKDILKSNVVKKDNNGKVKDYFFKRIIFPILDHNSKVVGFGGRSLDDTQPKYINSPESEFFQKRYLLYNLSEAKIFSRKKNNLLICEGYTDVISLYEKGIKSVVAPLGTALTEQQLNLSWKFCDKPTIMFDGDNAGKRASYKTALMSLKLITTNKFIQFALLPDNHDPDSFINSFSVNDLISLLRKPYSLVNFIFDQARLAYPINSADSKIIFDKYIDDIVNTIADKKIKYFYKNELKSLFFENLKNKKNKNVSTNLKNINKISIMEKQIYSFILTFINHQSIRTELLKELLDFKYLDNKIIKLLKIFSSDEFINKNSKDFLISIEDNSLKKLLENCLKSEIFQLFPYSSADFDSFEALKEIRESCKNLKTRLSNLQEIDKSLNSFREDVSELNWDELQKINKEIFEEQNI